MGTDISYIWKVGLVHGEEGKGGQLLFNASQGDSSCQKGSDLWLFFKGIKTINDFCAY